MAVEFHRTGILVMSHGTPESLDEIEDFYTKIRRGSPPPPHLLNELISRYQAIGGLSPLREITFAQARNLAIALGGAIPMAVGTKFSSPSIEQAIDSLALRGVNNIICIVMSPQDASNDYFERAKLYTGATLTFLRSWHTNPHFLEFHANQIRTLLTSYPNAKVIFTAHSLPVASKGVYCDQVSSTANSIAQLLPNLNWTLAWQSAGRTDQEWLGPDIRDVLRNINEDSVIVAPIGFASDNLETLYDLDIEAAGVAKECNIEFARTHPPNSDLMVMASLAQELLALIKHE